MTTVFKTGETNKEGNPLAHGLLLNFATIKGDYQKAIADSIRAIVNKNPRNSSQGSTVFAPPYMILDLAYPVDIDIQVPCEGGEFTKWQDVPASELPADLDSPDAKCAKILVSAANVVDLSHISGSTSVIRCNPAVPVYAWFQAANLLLTHHGSQGRLVPFPIHHPEVENNVVYNMLRVNLEEYQAYHKILQFSCDKDGPQQGFDIASKFAYTILEKRGIAFEDITEDLVDNTISHVHLVRDACNYGVLLLNAPRDELEEMKDSHYVFY